MKKVFSILAVAAILVGAQSCAKDCVECTGAGAVSICEKDYTSVGGVSWSTYKAGLLTNPNCKEK